MSQGAHWRKQTQKLEVPVRVMMGGGMPGLCHQLGLWSGEVTWPYLLQTFMCYRGWNSAVLNHAVHAMADPGNSQTAFQSDPRISLLVISPLVTAFLFLGWAHCLQILTQAPHSTTVQMDTELVEKITFKQSKQHPVERFNQLGGCLVTWGKVSC